MHIAYSALRNSKAKTSKPKECPFMEEKMKGYTAACNRLSNEIAAIQQRIPGWMPPAPHSGAL
ncbi:hypothetical protein [Mucilaginibacter gynuensis]|uniref:hypothetical protein n=1 Tax=Mucilaginibacter gynuensis TaxID=1302236 RepID=UPI0031EF75B0